MRIPGIHRQGQQLVGRYLLSENIGGVGIGGGLQRVNVLLYVSLVGGYKNETELLR